MDVTAHCLSYVMRVEGAHIIAATSKYMDQCVYRKESWEGVYKNAMIDFGTVRLRDWAMRLLGEITSQASLIRVCPHNAFILPHMSASVELQWTWRRVLRTSYPQSVQLLFPFCSAARRIFLSNCPVQPRTEILFTIHGSTPNFEIGLVTSPSLVELQAHTEGLTWPTCASSFCYTRFRVVNPNLQHDADDDRDMAFWLNGMPLIGDHALRLPRDCAGVFDRRVQFSVVLFWERPQLSIVIRNQNSRTLRTYDIGAIPLTPDTHLFIAVTFDAQNHYARLHLLPQPYRQETTQRP